jgi:hypothetical protein
MKAAGVELRGREQGTSVLVEVLRPRRRIGTRGDEALLSGLLADAKRRADLRPRAPLLAGGGRVAIEQLVAEVAQIVRDLDRGRQLVHRVLAMRTRDNRPGELIEAESVGHGVNLPLTLASRQAGIDGVDPKTGNRAELVDAPPGRRRTAERHRDAFAGWESGHQPEGIRSRHHEALVTGLSSTPRILGFTELEALAHACKPNSGPIVSHGGR